VSYQSRTSLLAVVGLTSFLGGCSDIYYDRRESIGLGAGDAVASNKVAQIVDPWPANVTKRSIAFDGQRMQAAQERYRQNKVITPVGVATSSASYQKSQSETPAASGAPASAAPAAPVRTP
jgi:hypothetical protein